MRHQTMMVRGYPHHRFPRHPKPQLRPKYLLVFDVETTADWYQRLLFGSALLYDVEYPKDGTVKLVPSLRYIFYTDDLRKFRPKTLKAIQRFGTEHPDFQIVTHKEFLETCFLKFAKIKNAAMVGFNISFDMFSLGFGGKVSEAQRAPFTGGLSLQFPVKTPVRYRETKAGIGHLREFSFRVGKGKGEGCQIIDMSELVRALTETRHSLLSAGKVFNASVRKYEHAEIHDPEINYKGGDLNEYLDHYVGYNVNDTEATASLSEKVLEEFFRHPLDMRADKAFSASAIGKQYYREMGVHPPLCECQYHRGSAYGGHKIDLHILDKCMTGYYGARTDCLIRRMALPAVYLDFTSDYPTQIILLGIWEMMRAEWIEAREETESVQEFLDNLTLPELYELANYQQLCGVAEVMPDAHLLPLRSRYTGIDDAPNIAQAYVTADRELCWSLPDLAVCKIRTGKIPRIVRAWRFYPSDEFQSTLAPVRLRNELLFDPRTENPFVSFVNERQRCKKRHKTNQDCEGWSADKDECLCPDCKMERFLKVLCNSIGYGIFGEMNDDKAKKSIPGTVGGIGGETWDIRNPERTGEWTFPPFASIITGGARLFLGMLQTEIEQLNGKLAYCDTDSGIIPASVNGGTVSGIDLLTYAQVDNIREQFNRLNPYDISVVPQLLKQEHPEPGESEVIYYGISAKRYCLYRVTLSGEVEIVKWSEHGLGSYMNPITPDEPDEKNTKETRKNEWCKEVWKYIIHKDVLNDGIQQPGWFDRPAVTSWPVRTWHAYSALHDFNTVRMTNGNRRNRPQQILPYRFGLAPYLSIGELQENRDSIRLLGSYSREAGTWVDMEYVDVHTHRRYRITTSPEEMRDGVIMVKDYREVIHRYINHPESKYDGPDSRPCKIRTRGILQPSSVTITDYEVVSKDASSIVLPEDLHTYRGSMVYHADGKNRVYLLARDFFRESGYGWPWLSEHLGITEWQARNFLSKSVNPPRPEVFYKIVQTAALMARAQYPVEFQFVGYSASPLSVLEMWKLIKEREEEKQVATELEDMIAKLGTDGLKNLVEGY